MVGEENESELTKKDEKPEEEKPENLEKNQENPEEKQENPEEKQENPEEKQEHKTDKKEEESPEKKQEKQEIKTELKLIKTEEIKKEKDVESEYQEMEEGRMENMLMQELKRKIAEMEKQLLQARNEQRKEKNNTSKEPSIFSTRNDIRYEDLKDLLPAYQEHIPIEQFLTQFEQITETFQLNDKQKLCYCVKLLRGPVKDFIQSKPLKENFLLFKEDLITEFGRKINSAEIHEFLCKEWKRRNENFITFYYRILKIASKANLDEESIKYYVIKNLQETRAITVQLQATANLRELREMMERLDKEQVHPSTIENSRSYGRGRIPSRENTFRRTTMPNFRQPPMERRDIRAQNRPPYQHRNWIPRYRYGTANNRSTTRWNTAATTFRPNQEVQTRVHQLQNHTVMNQQNE